MRKFMRQALYFIVIIMLLPYVITVFVNGNGLLYLRQGDNPYITVSRDEVDQEMLMDEYGIGILAKEIDADTEMEALKAQAVLIRTSIYKTLQEEGTDTVLKKNYWTRSQMKTNWGADNYEKNYNKMKEAWMSTKETVLIYAGNLALTPYHRVSNGKTRSANEIFKSDSFPYLSMKECPKDLEAEEAVTVSLLQETGLQVLEQDSAGYVTRVRCGTEEIQGEEFRSTYHLTSSCFVLEDFEGKTRVTTHGLGHGLGMSQYTADIMAKEGKSYQEIINYFFEGTTFEEVAEILVKPE